MKGKHILEKVLVKKNPKSIRKNENIQFIQYFIVQNY